MRVITLNNDQFATACNQLMGQVTKAGFEPDAVIGIVTGGARVAAEIRGNLKGYDVEYSRPSSPRKKALLGKWLKLIPRPLLNVMRMMESKWLSSGKAKPRTDHPMVKHDDYKRILLVDDAVDSGATLHAVKQALEQAMPQAAIQTAVITVTFRHPIIQPNYCLYNDGTLIRFPWSIDYRD